MSAGIELVPLKCLGCEAPLPSRPQEIAWRCEVCGQGQMLQGEHGLQPLEIHFAAGIAAQAAGKPFWIAEGRVSVQRETYGGRAGEAAGFWDEPRRFCIPAFDLELEPLLEAAAALLRYPPDLTPGPPAAFAPVTLAPEDLRPLVEFTVLTVEAERKDKLRKVQVALELNPAELWILP